MDRWNAHTLEAMRLEGDPLADDTVAALETYGEDEIKRLFRALHRSDHDLSRGDPSWPPVPPPLAAFIDATSALPADADLARIARGDNLFLEHALLVALGLLSRSLPHGYAAPRLASILHMTGNLERHPYRRVLGVLQFLVNISSSRAFEPGGLAVVTAQKMRLLHAGIRRMVRRSPQAFDEARWGVPVSQLDMAFTITTFSHDVVQALRCFGVKPEPQVEEDYLHLWRVYGQMQGIRPEWLPMTLQEAAAFSQAYGRLHFAEAADNVAGVALTRADLRMMRELLPHWLRALGLGALPELMMARQLGPEAAARVGVRRHAGHRVLEWLLLAGPVAWTAAWRRLTPSHAAHHWVSRQFFEALIHRAWGGEVMFTVPYSKLGLEELA